MKNSCLNRLIVVSALLTSTAAGFSADRAHEPDVAGVAKVPVQTGAVEQDRFGPAVDVVLDSDFGGTNYVLDLDTGRLMTPAHEMALNRLWKSDRLSFQESALAWRAYLRGLGADIVNEENLTGLRLCLAKLEPLKDEKQWDSISATECGHKIDGLRQETHPLNDSTIVFQKLPSTWIFQTREGNRGMFQICEVRHQPKQVRIRYKLIQTTTGG